MDRDRKLDEFFETAEAPKHIHCLTCGRLMKVIYKDLRQAVFDDEKNRILFMYECPNKCLPRRAFFDDGKEYVPKPHLCPKCQNHLEEKKGKQLKNKIVINEICHNCGYKHKRIYKFSNPKKKKIDSNFAKDRAHFCLSEKEGSEYISSKAQLLSLYPIIEDQVKKKNRSKKVKSIKKLNIAQLSQYLNKKLLKNGYRGLTFSKPEITSDVIINFTIQETKLDREEYDSKNELRKLIGQLLKNTNWHLMTGGVSYKLGILSGKLRGEDKN